MITVQILFLIIALCNPVLAKTDMVFVLVQALNLTERNLEYIFFFVFSSIPLLL